MVVVFLPITKLSDFKVWDLMRRLTNPKLIWIFSVNPSFGPIIVGSLVGSGIPRLISAFVSKAKIKSCKITMVNPLVI